MLLTLGLLVSAPVLVQAATLHLSGDTARVVFNAHAVDAMPIEMVAHNGQLNLSGVMVANDVVGGEASLREVGRKLSELSDTQSCSVAQLETVNSQQVTIATQAATIASQHATIALLSSNAPPSAPAGPAAIALRADMTRTGNDGGGHVCALVAMPSGNVTKCWGKNGNGQLGLGDTAQHKTPTTVTALGTDVVSIELGGYHTCAILKDATVKCWGDNHLGQLGLGDTAQRTTPTTVTALGTDVASIELGDRSTCAILKDATVKCWGNNQNGQLGLGDTTRRTTPTTVTALGTDVVSIHLGGAYEGRSHCCAILRDGTTKCWGNNNVYNEGTLGLGDTTQRTTPTTVTELGTDAVSLALNWAHSCAVLRDGSVKCWGRGAYIGQEDGLSRNIPTTVTALGTDVASITVGVYGSCAILNNATVKCFGHTGAGELGIPVCPDGTVTCQTPTTVTSFGTDVVSIVMGQHYSCALRKDGTVKCFGDNVQGVLGGAPSTVPSLLF
jgi:alpha-tubulin suppressor-like RCC1 family protein